MICSGQDVVNTTNKGFRGGVGPICTFKVNGVFYKMKGDEGVGTGNVPLSLRVLASSKKD